MGPRFPVLDPGGRVGLRRGDRPHRGPWGTRTPYDPGTRWPERIDCYLADGISPESVDRWVQSAAVLHSNGDGLDIAVKDGRIVGVRGRAVDRVNHGRLDPKDLFGWQANDSRDRLTTPMVRVGGELKPCDWDTAMDRIVARSKELLDRHGPSSIGLYTSGQLFIEAYYTQGAIAHGAIGTNHVDGNTRLCTATAAEALKESFGCDGQPGSYTDVDHADVIALFGHNVAETQTVPFALITGRTVYHFHTRTKTARAQQLQDAAPEVWVEVSQRDASRLGIAECDAVEVSTPRGTITCAARICGIRDGVLFVPFHYGYWDADDRGCSRGHHRADRAANELTPTDWDPVSKQPIYKTGAARLRKSAVSHARRADSPGFAAAPTTTASAPVNGGVPATVGGAAAGVTEVVPAVDRP